MPRKAEQAPRGDAMHGDTGRAELDALQDPDDSSPCMATPSKSRGDPKQGDAKPVDAGQGNAKRARRAITREAYLTTSKATPS